jgi:hypothetical protein
MIHAVLERDLIQHPIVPDRLALGWIQEDTRSKPEMSKVAPAPTSVVELVQLNCGSSNPDASYKCTTARCLCRAKGIVCAEMYRCEGEMEMCQNMNSHLGSSDMV